MRLIFRLVLLLLLLLPVAVGTLLWYGLEPAPTVETTEALSHEDVARARQIITQNDPRRLKPGTRHTLSLNEEELSLAASYLMRTYGRGDARIALQPGQLELLGSIRLPENPINPYLNLQLTVEERDGTPSVGGLRLGQIDLPGGLAGSILSQTLKSTFPSRERERFARIFKALDLSDGRLNITYEWQPELIAEMRAELVTPIDKEMLESYSQALASISRRENLGRRSSLVKILVPLFEHVRIRSREGDPVMENRAAILVLAAYIRPKGFDSLLPDIGNQRSFSLPILTLERRKDFTEHFLVSAALAAAGDTTLADAAGLYKEIADSKGHSGFSFTDLAADRAGTRFGEYATASPQKARRLQEFLAAGAVENDIMPKAGDLPEHMGEREFTRRFGSIHSPAFRELQQLIEQRIAACRLYREQTL